jgi:hypothetical protein
MRLNSLLIVYNNNQQLTATAANEYANIDTTTGPQRFQSNLMSRSRSLKGGVPPSMHMASRHMTLMNGTRGTKRNDNNQNSLFNSLKNGKIGMSIE